MLDEADLVSVPRRGLGTVGQVGRSRNAQTADKRASGDYVTLGGRKSALLLLSPTTDTATTAIANLPLLLLPLHHHLAPSPTIVSSPRPRTVYKQILPPFQTAFTIVRHRPGLPPWIDLAERTNEGTVDRSVTAMSLQLVELIEQTALRKIAGSQKAPAKENDPRLNASLRNCPTPPVRRASVVPPCLTRSRSILRYVPFLSSFSSSLPHPTVISLADTSLYRRPHPSSLLRVSLSFPSHLTPPSRTSSFQPGIDCETPSRVR